MLYGTARAMCEVDTFPWGMKSTRYLYWFVQNQYTPTALIIMIILWFFLFLTTAGSSHYLEAAQDRSISVIGMFVTIYRGALWLENRLITIRNYYAKSEQFEIVSENPFLVLLFVFLF